jgi:hypothetical protein
MKGLPGKPEREGMQAGWLSVVKECRWLPYMKKLYRMEAKEG